MIVHFPLCHLWHARLRCHKGAPGVGYITLPGVLRQLPIFLLCDCLIFIDP
jgi:hypothetical protein